MANEILKVLVEMLEFLLVAALSMLVICLALKIVILMHIRQKSKK